MSAIEITWVVVATVAVLLHPLATRVPVVPVLDEDDAITVPLEKVELASARTRVPWWRRLLLRARRRRITTYCAKCSAQIEVAENGVCYWCSANAMWRPSIDVDAAQLQFERLNRYMKPIPTALPGPCEPCSR